MRIDRRALQNLPKGVISFALKLPALKQIRAQRARRPRHPGRGRRLHRAHLPLRRARHPARAQGLGHQLPPLDAYAEKLWDYWERTLDPDLYKDRSFEGAVNGKTVIITGASSGIGRAAALKIAAAGGIPILVARTKEKLDEVKDEIEAEGGTAYVAPCDLSDFDAIDDAGRDAARRPPADRHARQQRRPLASGAASRCPTTASTTTSARSTSTT